MNDELDGQEKGIVEVKPENEPISKNEKPECNHKKSIDDLINL